MSRLWEGEQDAHQKASGEMRCGLALMPFEGYGHGIKRQRAEQVAAHALLDLDEGAGGAVDPVDGEAFREAGEFGVQIEVADERRGSGHDEQQVLNEAAEGAEQVEGLLLAVGAAAVGVRGAEEAGEIRFPQRVADEQQSILAAGEVDAEVEGDGAADGALSEASGQGAVAGVQLWPALGEDGFNLRRGQGAEAGDDGAGANGGQQLQRILSEDDERGVLGRFLEKFQKAVGRLLHEGGAGEDGEGAAGFDGRAVVGRVNDLANLAELDEELGRIGRDDEQVRMRLDEDAGFALVGLAEVVAGGHGGFDQLFKVAGAADAGAVGAGAAEVGQAVGQRLLEAVHGLGEHDGHRVLAGAAGAGQDERVGKAAGAHALAQVRDGGRVAEEFVKAHVVEDSGWSGLEIGVAITVAGGPARLDYFLRAVFVSMSSKGLTVMRSLSMENKEVSCVDGRKYM